MPTDEPGASSDASAQEILALMRQATIDRREDLRDVFNNHAENMATSILLQQSAAASMRLLDADPNTAVDVVDPANFTNPATETP